MNYYEAEDNLLKQPPIFTSPKDVDRYVNRRLLLVGIVCLVASVISVFILQGVLGVFASVFDPALFALAAWLGDWVHVVAGFAINVLLPCAPWSVVAYRYERTLKQRIKRTDCVRCDYALRELAEATTTETLVCPECGASYGPAFTPNHSPPASPRPS